MLGTFCASTILFTFCTSISTRWTDSVLHVISQCWASAIRFTNSVSSTIYAFCCRYTSDALIATWFTFLFFFIKTLVARAFWWIGAVFFTFNTHVWSTTFTSLARSCASNFLFLPIHWSYQVSIDQVFIVVNSVCSVTERNHYIFDITREFSVPLICSHV